MLLRAASKATAAKAVELQVDIGATDTATVAPPIVFPKRSHAATEGEPGPVLSRRGAQHEDVWRRLVAGRP